VLTGIVKFPLTTGAWTDIAVPFPCSYFLIIGNEDVSGNRVDLPVLRCSDKSNPVPTQYTMKADDWFALVANARFGAYRYPTAGVVATYLKAISTPVTAIIEFYQ
jgi:hypothetical protein